MDDRFNTIAGWVLFAGIIALGLSIVSGKFFHADKPERPETLGYIIEGVEAEGGAAEMTMAQALNMEGVDASKGQAVFAKCTACHTIEQGGANGIGPNLWGVMGTGIGKHAPGFAYSSALADKGGTWDWEAMDAWLKSPRAFANGTKMSFAGLSKIEDRAAVAIYMNENGSNLPVPEYVEVISEIDGEAAEGEEAATEEGAEGEEAATEAAE
jgi:cytochrome c